MVKSLGKRLDLCVGCRICESVCSNLYFKEDDREKSAIKIEEQDGSYRIIACTQCGACVDICPAQAIERKKNAIIINKKECIQCLSCVGFCPEGAMGYHRDVKTPFKCISCGSCARECSEEAIFIVREEEA